MLELDLFLHAPADLTTSRATRLHLARVLTARVLAGLIVDTTAEPIVAILQ